MLFNSLVFALFFPVVWTVWRLLPAAREATEGKPARAGWPRKLWLLAASLFFYGWWDIRFLGLLLLTSTVDFVVGRLLDDPQRKHRKAILAVSVVVNLGVLAVFKYLGFFTGELDKLLALVGIHGFPVLQVLLPVGLSFYTFQAIGYSVDVYRGQVKACRNLLDFLLFISFFPHLVAGPIQRSHILIPQIVRPRDPTPLQLGEGMQLMLWGFFKKVVVADNLAPAVAAAFDAKDPSGWTVLVGAYAFTWQIYCDFSGYSDVARGLAKWLGVELIINFDLPFFADSPRDLWRRWHISLSQWLRDYLYIPLGGNKKHAQRNLILTMLLGGLWHGANWTFLVWGAWHGVALAIQRTLPSVKVWRPLAILLTFHFTMLGFVIFRAHDLGQLGGLALAALSDPLPHTDAEIASGRLLGVLAAPVVLFELAQYVKKDWRVLFYLPRVVQGLWAAVLFILIVMLGATVGQQFIYFQF